MSEPMYESAASPEDFTPYEQQLAAQISAAGQRPGNRLAEVALGVGAAFLLYRLYTRRRLSEETREALPTPDALQELSVRVLSAFVSKWQATLVPALVTGYVIGMQEAGNAVPDRRWLVEVANAKAASMGTSIHATSTDAMVSGYRTMLNRRVAGRVALDRAIDAFGVLPRTMKSLVNLWLTPPPVNLTDKPAVSIGDRIDSMIAKAVASRADTIGDTEAYLASNEAKILLWAYEQSEGLIPDEAEKVWVTAHDERVCKVCGPMNGVAVRLNELFELPTGDWVTSPSPHPRCRCTLSLRMNTQAHLRSYVTVAKSAEELPNAFGIVHKAVGVDPFDRDKSGRFSSTESRRSKVQVRPVARQQYKEPDVDFTDPRVAQILAQAQAMASSPVRAREQARAHEQAKASSPQKASAPVRASASVKASSQQKASSVASSSTAASSMATSAVASTGQARKASNGAARARAMEKGKASFVPPDKPMATSAEATDLWVNTPDNRPIYVVMSQWDWGEADTVMTDFDTPFYTGGERGHGIDTLQEALTGYWEHFLSSDYTSDEFSGQAEWNDSVGEHVMSFTHGNMQIHTTYDAYDVAMVEAVHGLSRNESEQVIVHAEQEDSDGELIVSEFSLPAYDVAVGLGLHQEIESYIPVIGRTNKINADQFDDDQWGGMISNPGKWRVISSDVGSVASWASRESTLPLPYHMYDIDPEDLYP